MKKTTDIKTLILSHLKKKKAVRVSEIMDATGFSRGYITRSFRALRKEGCVVLMGKANQARYVLPSQREIEHAKENVIEVRRILQNKKLDEDTVFEEIKASSGIFFGVSYNVFHIIAYAFMEMLNNAMEHSQSKEIKVTMKRDTNLSFQVLDTGIGIFKNIKKKKNLTNELEAMQDLMKGKQTTMPERHSGEGIFFTSKIADTFIIKSSHKKLIFDNEVGDIFIRDSKLTKGTAVDFSISLGSKKELSHVFGQFTNAELRFNRTQIHIELYKSGSSHISRSQAKRVLNGLDKFEEIILDFKNVSSIGQGFADEVLRVWQNQHPNIKITVVNANENVMFMVKHVERPLLNGSSN